MIMNLPVIEIAKDPTRNSCVVIKANRRENNGKGVKKQSNIIQASSPLAIAGNEINGGRSISGF